jgi:hypothetical protein
MQAPTVVDWGSLDERNLDAVSAREHFCGKSELEAEALFRENALHYQEDLLSMPPVPFDFYAPVFARYVLSPEARGDSDAGSSFLALVEELLERQPHLAKRETLEHLLEAATRVAQTQSFYAADPRIYGSFIERHRVIHGLASHAAGK